jgi:hypothetical protein
MRQTTPLLLLALLCLLPAAAFAQPFWPDPDDAYPYEPEDAYEADPETNYRPTFEQTPPLVWRDPRGGMQTPSFGRFPQQQSPTAAVSLVEADLLPSFESATLRGQVILTVSLKNESSTTLTNLSFTIRITDRHGQLIARESFTGSSRVVFPSGTAKLEQTVVRFQCGPRIPTETCANGLAPLDLALWRAAQEGGWRATIENFSSQSFGGR